MKIPMSTIASLCYEKYRHLAADDACPQQEIQNHYRAETAKEVAHLTRNFDIDLITTLLADVETVLSQKGWQAAHDALCGYFIGMTFGIPMGFLMSRKEEAAFRMYIFVLREQVEQLVGRASHSNVIGF